MSPIPTATQISEREFVVEHDIRAPAAKIFAAYTDPDLIPKWWGLGGGATRVDAFDGRPGGSFRLIQRLPNGEEMVFRIKYLELTPVSRLVYTHATEGQPGELRATIELEEEDGVTHLVLTTLCPSKEARDAMIRFAVVGAKAAWRQLEAMFAKEASA